MNESQILKELQISNQTEITNKPQILKDDQISNETQITKKNPSF
jgi:uncharacterized ubiquitin-like protein YukD